MLTRLQHLKFLQIHSDDPALVRKGHLLQWLIFLVVVMGILRFLFDLPGLIATGSALEDGSSFREVVFPLLFGISCFYLIHIGRVNETAHVFTVVLLTLFLALLTTDYPRKTGLPYLLLIPIVAMASLVSIRASVIYALGSFVILGFITAVTPTYASGDYIFFVLVGCGICITTWVTAHALQGTIDRANTLATESQQKTELLQKRAHQLQQSAQMGQRTGTSLNLEQLLQDTAQLIREQFSFYHIAIFLLQEDKQSLILHTHNGPLDVSVLQEPYHVPIDPQSTIGWTAVNRTARIVHDVTATVHDPTLQLLAETRSEMALPLIARNQLLGVLNVQSRRTHAFQEEDAAMLQIMANQLAVNIDNAHLFAQTESSLHETRILYQFNTLLATTLDVGEIYRRAARTLAMELKARRCLIFSWQPENDTLTAEIGFEFGMGPDKLAGFFWDKAVYQVADYAHIQKTLSTLQPAIYHYDPTQTTPEQQILKAYHGTTCLELPMIQGTTPIGLIWFFRDKDQPPYQPFETQLAQAMSNQTAVALANAQLTSDAQVRVAQLSTINRMSVILSHAPSLKAIFNGARQEIMTLIPATGMSISLLTKERDKINWVYGYEYGHEVDLTNIPPLPITQGFSGHVIHTREMLYIDKKNTELRQKLQALVVGEDQATWLGLPMIVSGDLIGVLAVENEDSFNDREIELLKTIVGPLTSAIYNFIQLDELQAALEAQSNQRIQLQTAAEVAAATTSVLNLEELVQESVNLIKERFALYYVGLFLVDEETNHALLVAGTGAAGRDQVKEGRRLLVGGQSLIGGATGDGVPRITQDVSLDKEWLPNPHLPNTRSELALPLRVRGQIIGALTAQSVLPNLFTDQLIRVMQTLCDQLATAIENARLLARVEARAKRQQTLTQISTRLHQTSDVEEILNIGLQAISSHLDGVGVRLQLGNQAQAPSETTRK